MKIDFKKAILDIDALVNDLDYAIDNLDVIQTAMLESASQTVCKYGNAIYVIVSYLHNLQEDMAGMIECALRADHEKE